MYLVKVAFEAALDNAFGANIPEFIWCKPAASSRKLMPGEIALSDMHFCENLATE